LGSIVLRLRLLKTQIRWIAYAMRDEYKLIDMIASIYEAAVEPRTWPGLLEQIADAVGHASISLITAEDFDKPVDVWLARYGPACVDVRFRHYARPELNPGIGASMELILYKSCRASSSSQIASSKRTLPLDQF
jgi:hypothetical protein